MQDYFHKAFISASVPMTKFQGHKCTEEVKVEVVHFLDNYISSQSLDFFSITFFALGTHTSLFLKCKLNRQYFFFFIVFFTKLHNYRSGHWCENNECLLPFKSVLKWPGFASQATTCSSRLQRHVSGEIMPCSCHPSTLQAVATSVSLSTTTCMAQPSARSTSG